MPVVDIGAVGASVLRSVAIEGVGVGEIPDSPAGGPLCGEPGPPLDIVFEFAGVHGALVDVEVAITVAHPWIGDLDLALHAPTGLSHVIFSRLGAMEIHPGSGHLDCGACASLDGTYVFSDRAPLTPGFGEAAAATPPRSVVPQGSYRTSTVGGRCITAMTPTFAWLTDFDGTWTLRVRDVGFEFIGAITAATLTLTTAAVPSLVAKRRHGGARAGTSP